MQGQQLKKNDEILYQELSLCQKTFTPVLSHDIKALVIRNEGDKVIVRIFDESGSMTNYMLII